MIRTWLITGCSHGLGRSLANAVLVTSSKFRRSGVVRGPLRIVLGRDAYARTERTDKNRLDELRAWRQLSESTDFVRGDSA